MNRVAYKALRVLRALALILSPMQSVSRIITGAHDKDLNGMRGSAGASHRECGA